LQERHDSSYKRNKRGETHHTTKLLSTRYKKIFGLHCNL